MTVVYVEDGVPIETGTVKQSQLDESSLIFNADLNM
jgi:hypothetical protein